MASPKTFQEQIEGDWEKMPFPQEDQAQEVLELPEASVSCSLNLGKVGKLPREDMAIYGQQPDLDAKIFAVCEFCQKSILLAAFREHIDRRHTGLRRPHQSVIKSPMKTSTSKTSPIDRRLIFKIFRKNGIILRTKLTVGLLVFDKFY
ncbi:Hypothetical predicted protein [Cloeon dipterum]|uniref:Uncharacterized protein n=1 Tax=Cloeon dipterum TaxID=197152 RepID=A0A8S1DCZ7_9INSE|nr:Hypothetical predicted protein [Cloeon dipterum]